MAGLSASALAGTTESAPAPMQEPVSTLDWFVGASFGQIYDVGADIDANLNLNQDLGDLDFDMYTLQVGRRFNSGLYGFNSAFYLEVAYLNGDVDFNNPTGFGFLNSLNADINIVPITLNGMLERNIYGGLGFYVGGGLGYAFTDIDAGNQSDSDGGLYGQLFAGLNYKFTETFEMFGGARWVFLNDLEFGDSTLELDDGVAWEVGLRFNF